MGSSVPEGPNEGSQAVYCLGLRQIVTRPEGTVWSSVTPGCGCVLGLSKPELTFAVKIRLTPRNHQSYRPSGTEPLGNHFPRHFVPGYHRTSLRDKNGFALRGHCPPCKSDRLTPESSGMHRLNHVANRVYAILKLLFTDCQRRRYFQDHEVVSADLR
jgi:hypothetical protein